MKAITELFLNLHTLEESSLASIWKLNNEYDCGCITAFRKARDCGEREPYTRSDKLKMNKILKAKLLSYGFRIIKLIGKYPEGGIISVEEAFFVIDDKELGLFDKLVEFGEEFKQDSILYVPKGSVSGIGKAFLYGTNHCENNWLGYRKKKYFDISYFGKENPIYTSYYQGRPFILYDAPTVLKEELLPNTGQGMWMLHSVAQQKVK